MGIFDGCILASDYDGTLAQSDGQIGERVRTAIKYFTDNGGYFTVCTGRTRQGFHAYEPSIINAPVLLGNGAMAYDFGSEKTVFLNCIDNDAIDEFEMIINGYPDIAIEFYTTDFKSRVIHPDDRSRAHFDFQYIKYEVVDDVKSEDFPLVKIMISVGVERVDDFQKFLDSLNLKKIKYIPQHGDFIEIISTKTDKGFGLSLLAEKLGCDKNKIYSIGDGSNDISMLKSATIGFVPENGCDVAKENGDIIVCSNNDGAVADAIYKIEELLMA